MTPMQLAKSKISQCLKGLTMKRQATAPNF